jgi:hypothetical protein
MPEVKPPEWVYSKATHARNNKINEEKQHRKKTNGNVQNGAT